MKQRIDHLGGLDDVRARFSVEREPDVNHVIGFSKTRQPNPIIENAKESLKQEKGTEMKAKPERPELGRELVARINAKLAVAGLPEWSELGYREPQCAETLFKTKEARPMENLVEYRKIDGIGLLHRPFLVDYCKDSVTLLPT